MRDRINEPLVRDYFYGLIAAAFVLGIFWSTFHPTASQNVFFYPTLVNPLSALELTHVSRKWGLQTGLPLLPLQGLDKSSLLSANVRSSTTHHKHIKVITRATGVLSNEPSSIGLIDSDLKAENMVL